MEVEKILVNLIQNSLSLPSNYGVDSEGNQIPCVVIANQNIKLFNTEHLQITIKTISSNVFANRTEYFERTVNNTTEFCERQMINEKRTIQIDVYSKNNEARNRYWEVQACLSSTLAQQLQDEYQFKIFEISQANNISGLDGSSDINRYSIRFNTLTWQEKVNVIDYYNNFRTTAQDGYATTTKFADFTIQE